MFIRLEQTYEPLRAQIAAGVLRTHGIAAWVAGDVSSSNYGTIASGGCAVMVKEADAEEAKRILDASPAVVEPGAGVEPPPPGPLTFWASLGAGVVQGAIWLPVLSVVLYAVVRVISALLGSAMPGKMNLFSRGVVSGLSSLALSGALVGLFGGLAAWLLSSYRHRGGMGIAFVMLIILLILVPTLFLMS